MENLLTVVCLSYNHKEYITHALESFLSQKTTFPFHVLIADDCSTDGTQEIIQGYVQQYPTQITAILRDKNLGPYDNSVATYSLVNSKYFIYCDGDDFFLDPLKLQKQVDFLEEYTDFSICFHPVQIYEAGQPLSIFPAPSYRFNKTILDLQDLLQHNFIQTNSCMYRWRFAGGEKLTDVFPKDISPGDYFLHLLHAEKGKIGFLDDIMSGYRKWAGGIWQGAGETEDWFFRFGEKHLRFLIEIEKRYGDNKKADIVGIATGTLLALFKRQDIAKIRFFRQSHPAIFAIVMGELMEKKELFGL